MILPSCRCSMTCAHQPAVRAITKSGVNRSTGNAHQVIGDGAVPVEIGKHALGFVHHLLDAFGDGKEPLAFGVDGQIARDFFHDVAARIAMV